jgi:alpha-D-xyloside xylohydrolase
MVFVKKALAVYILVIIFAMTGCTSQFVYKVEKLEHSVKVYQDSSIIEIEIVDESIIHVKKSLINDRSTALPDYVTILEPQDVDWKIKEHEDQLIISTNTLKVFVNSDGTIEYQSKDGQNLVSETNEQTYIKSELEEGRTVSQAFLAGDEALYGLGQFQSGIMNWKNVPNRLEQFNQEIAVPFLVSTNNYGIYWHNYSLTDFNKTQHEITFSDSDDEVKATKEEKLGKDAENVIKYKAKAVKDKNIRETIFTPKKSGMYSFFVESDTKVRMRGEIRVTIDSDTIVDYSTIWVPTCYSGVKKLVAGNEYKVAFQNTGASIAGSLFYNEPDYDKTVFSSERGNIIDYYLVHGDNPAAVIAEYQKLTGKAPMFSKKSYGFWQCRERYHNQAELLENAREMRNKKIPFDNIVQDWFYWPEGTKGPEWDRAKYPDPKAMTKELSDLNLNLMVSVWPMVDNDPLLEKYDLLHHKLGAKNHNLDFYNEGVSHRYYRMLSDSIFHFGVKSIWLDGTEPAGRPKKDAQTAVGTFSNVYNTYSLLVTKAMYEGRRNEFPEERVFNLTRSAYSGQQRYGAACWSGDVAATWKQFQEQISAGLNFTMAGVPYWTHDIGGFFRDANSLNPIYDDQYTNPEFIELMTRWFQFGAFSPIFRIHGYVSETEIWRYGQDFEDMARKFIDLRYQLMPYIYSEAWKVTNESHLLMSPLVYQYPNDKTTWGIKDQFFFGESMMVSFVTEYRQRNKEVYLPEGEWFNFWTNEKIAGSKTVTVEAPFNSTPIFVKAGSIIPTGPKVQYATEETDEPLRLKVYPGKDAEYVLYLDDNETYDYEKGEYSEIVFSYSEASKELDIKNGEGSFINFEQNPMNMVIEIIGEGKEEIVNFKGTKLSVKL